MYSVFFKRVVDVFLSVVLVFLFSPIFLFICIIMFIFYGNKVFYVHNRLGYYGEVIYVYKFRTMILNSEQILESYLDNHPKEKVIWKQNQKLYNDPRVTKFGRFLRMFSLDELPQIFNVIRGDMSLVGPRPIVDEEIVKYGESFKLYKSIKPGITGLWQISGRSNLSYAQRIELDIYYIKNVSFFLDLSILIKTLPVIIFKKGAY